jgi:hypothetical protein
MEWRCYCRNFVGRIVPGSFLLLERPFSSTLLAIFMQFPPSPQILGMKFAFEIKTEPTLRTAIIIAITITSLGALAMITVYLDNPSIAIYSVTILTLIIWIAITKMSP